jgi:itaconyl-CoA hydratase
VAEQTVTAPARTDPATYFEDFEVGRRWRSARGTTIGEAENQLISKLVMNTAQEHWNDDSMKDSPWGASRIVFGLVTASTVIGLASQDASENAIAELGLDDLRLMTSVFHGDTVYACTEVLATTASDDPDAGIVTFQHWGFRADGVMVCRVERSVLVRRRPATKR